MSQDFPSPAAADPLPTEEMTMGGRLPSTPASACWMKWAVVLLPIAYLWFRLINNVSVEWATNPQYSYGWVVPLLCVGLLLRRWQAAREKLKAEMLKAEICKSSRQRTPRFWSGIGISKPFLMMNWWRVVIGNMPASRPSSATCGGDVSKAGKRADIEMSDCPPI